MRDGGRKRLPRDRYVYRPTVTATAGLPGAVPCAAPEEEVPPAAAPEEEEEEVLLLPSAGVVECWRYRSPRIQTSACMTVFPPRIICWVPRTCARRETLLPVSFVSLYPRKVSPWFLHMCICAMCIVHVWRGG